MTIAGLKRALPICRVNDNLYIGAFVIFGDCELTMACATELLKKAPEYDYLITAESKGIPLAYEMARQHGDKKWLLARKGAKLYMQNVVGVEVKSITTAAVQKLYLDGADAALMKGKRVLIVDDVISTGESPTHWKRWSIRRAAKSWVAWRFWRRATRRSARTSSTSKSCRCSTRRAKSSGKSHLSSSGFRRELFLVRRRS